MATFINASVLGISQESQFLGESTARLRTVKTFSIEGFIDSRTNTDLQGVKDTVETITNLNKTFSGPSSATALMMEDIIINGTNYGKGKVVSLSFASSADFKENQITLGSFSATIEFYLAGDISSIYGSNAVDQEFLEDFSERFSFSLAEDSSYDYEHSLGIKYIEGTRANNTTINPFSAAKTLAESVFARAITDFNGILDSHFGDHDSLGKRYFTEKYNKQTGDCSFTKKFKAYQKNGTTYSASITNSFDVNEQGITTIVEKGTIRGRTSNLLASALDGLNQEISNSFARCSTIYTTYKNYLYPSLSSSLLKNVIINSSKSIDNNSGDVEYSLTYTNDEAFNNLTFTEERTLKFNKEVISTVEENTTRTFLAGKSESFLSASLMPSVPALEVAAAARCLLIYLRYASSKIGTLKKLKSSINFPRFGNSYSYTVSFSDSDSILSSGPFIEKSIAITDENGGPVFESFQIPNKRREFLHFPAQNNLNTRSVKASVKLRRREFTNNFYDYSGFKDQISIAVSSLFNELKLRAYSVFSEKGIFTLDRDVFITELSYSINSDYTMTMDLTVNYPTLFAGGQPLSI